MEGDNPIRIQWIRNKKTIISDGQDGIVRGMDGRMKVSFHLLCSYSKDSTYYYCVFLAH